MISIHNGISYQSPWGTLPWHSDNTTIEELDTEFGNINRDDTSFPDFTQKIMDDLYVTTPSVTLEISSNSIVLKFSSALDNRGVEFTKLLNRLLLAEVTNQNDAFQAMLATENVLRLEWDKPEEDEAWSHL